MGDFPTTFPQSAILTVIKGIRETGFDNEYVSFIFTHNPRFSLLTPLPVAETRHNLCKPCANWLPTYRGSFD